MRRQVMYAVDLNIGHYKDADKGDLGLSVYMMKESMRAILAKLTREAIRKNWHCIIYGAVSNSSPVTGKKVRPHVHLIVYGSPCSAIAKSIKADWIAYWTERRYQVYPLACHVKLCETDGKVSYIWAQEASSFVRLINYPSSYASELFEIDEAEVKYYLQPQGRKWNILLALLGYQDEDRISVTDFPMIRECKRPYDSAYLRYLGVLDDYKKQP